MRHVKLSLPPAWKVMIQLLNAFNAVSEDRAGISRKLAKPCRKFKNHPEKLSRSPFEKVLIRLKLKV